MALRIEGLDDPIEPVPSDSPTRGRAAVQPDVPVDAPAVRAAGRDAAPVADSAEVQVAPETPGRPTPVRARPATGSAREPKPSRQASPAAALDSVDVDASLGTDPKPINTRVASDLWDLVAQRADDLGVPLRLLITDALVEALELDPATHTARVKATRRREQLAKIDAE